MKNGLDKICRENQNTRLCSIMFLWKLCHLWGKAEKIWYSQARHRWQNNTTHKRCNFACPIIKAGIQRHTHNSFIHLVSILTTGPKPLPKRALHIVRPRASSKWVSSPFLNPLKTKHNLLYIWNSPYRAVNTFHHRLVEDVYSRGRYLFWDPYKTLNAKWAPCRISEC
jgi:hypothetical protein